MVQTCRTCGVKYESAPPILDKKVIYLDQWIVSGLAKVLDPVTIATKGLPSDAEYWLALWDQLHRLVQLHIAVFPKSPAHQDESVVIPNYYSVHRAVYEHLAPNAELRYPLEIFPAQVGRIYFGQRDGIQFPVEILARGKVFQNNYNQWADHVMRFRIAVRWGRVRDEVERLHDFRASSDENLRSDAERWATQRERKFAEWFEEQRTIGVRTLLAALKGDPLGSFYDVTMRILQDLIAKSSSRKEAVRSLVEFISSEACKAAPYNQLSAALFAGIARHVANGQRPDSINGGHWVDVNTIAAYTPYCDAMCVDGYFAGLLREVDIAKIFSLFSCRFFTYKTKEEFLAYLQELERNADPALIATVATVFGDTWVAPYRNILSYNRDRDKRDGHDKRL
jgi:hypothetical protein